MPVWRGTTPRCAPCAWRTVRTRSITGPLLELNFRRMQTPPQHTKGSSTVALPPAKRGSVAVVEGVRRDDEYSGTKPVEERHRFDEARLEDWMSRNVEGFRGPLTVLQFKGGQ